MAGKAGIDRLKNNGIVNNEDIATGKVKIVGNKFIDKTGFNSHSGCDCIAYCPTWEGGIEEENYSSLSYTDYVGRVIVEAFKKKQNNCLVIKLHPNIGFRNKNYYKYLLNLCSYMKCYCGDIRIVIVRNGFEIPFMLELRLRLLGIQLNANIGDFKAILGFCDVSAVETQFLNENIEYYIFINKNGKKIDFYREHKYYKTAALGVDGEIELQDNINSDFVSLKKYFIS